MATVRKRLLVVDDEQLILDMIREHFAERYAVDTAISASRAVEAFERQRPDMIFLDINMPGVNGLTLLTFLRQVAPDLPVVIITANADSSVAAEVLRAGAFGYVPKPFNFVYMDHIAAVATRSA
jgi:CheY-like chemotaxis protein